MLLVRLNEFLFQSTLLMRGATKIAHFGNQQDAISIHAPHARSDLPHIYRLHGEAHFNPRSSCEERRDWGKEWSDGVKFQSTLLMRGATNRALSDYPIYRISIHAPHARSDRLQGFEHFRYRNFNPRSSCEERLGAMMQAAQLGLISIHAPHARSDRLYAR